MKGNKAINYAHMKKYIYPVFLIFFILPSCEKADENGNKENSATGMIIDHNCIKLSSVPFEYISGAKQSLHIAYSHTSHGSQVTSGMT